MSIALALADAANNCAREGAKTTITIKGSRVVVGKIEKAPTSGMDTIIIYTDDGGWETILIDEIAAVGSHR